MKLLVYIYISVRALGDRAVSAGTGTFCTVHFRYNSLELSHSRRRRRSRHRRRRRESLRDESNYYGILYKYIARRGIIKIALNKYDSTKSCSRKTRTLSFVRPLLLRPSPRSSATESVYIG